MSHAILIGMLAVDPASLAIQILERILSVAGTALCPKGMNPVAPRSRVAISGRWSESSVAWKDLCHRRGMCMQR